MAEDFILVQISDSHLFGDTNGLHHGSNVYQNLVAVLKRIKQLPQVDILVFTGDLTQDHSEESYQLFVQAFNESGIVTPVYYVPGNHDEPKLLKRFLAAAPFCQTSVIETSAWQILLLDSKSATPAGKVSNQQLQNIEQKIDSRKAQLILMHHHPVDVGYFIDRHGLESKVSFQNFVEANPSIHVIGCGHVHQALSLPIVTKDKTIPLYTCPATSIQFDKSCETVANNGQGPGFRCFTLKENKQVSTEVFFI